MCQTIKYLISGLKQGILMYNKYQSNRIHSKAVPRNSRPVPI